MSHKRSIIITLFSFFVFVIFTAIPSFNQRSIVFAGYACDANCSSNSECNSPYQCISGRCRNPSCNSQSSCLCDPANFRPECPVPGTTATLKWSSVSGATKYAIRLDDHTSSTIWNCDTQPGDVCRDVNAPATSSAFSTTAGHEYYGWIHSCNDNGCNSSAPNTGDFRCYNTALPAAQNFTYVCAGDGNSVTLRWDAISGANQYILRFNNLLASKNVGQSWMSTSDFTVGTIGTTFTTGWTVGSNGVVFVGTSLNGGNTNIFKDQPYNVSVQGVRAKETYPWSGAHAGLNFTCGATTCGAPSNSTPANGACFSSEPSLSASWGTGTSSTPQMRFVIDDNSNFNSLNCDGGYGTSNSYSSCSLSTDTYAWRAQNKAYSCTGEPYSTATTFGIDKAVPSAHNQAGASYSSPNISFSWTASTDSGCGSCSGYACNYKVRGRWYDLDGTYSSEFLSNDAFVPADRAAPSTSVSCSNKDGYTAKFQVLQAKDSLGWADTATAEDWANAPSYRCPVPQCTTPSNTSPADGACFGSNPSLVAAFGSSVSGNRLAFEVENNSSFTNNISCDRGADASTTFNTSSCTLPSLDTYYWRAKSTSSNLACTASNNSTAWNFKMDKAAPSDTNIPTSSYSVPTPTPGGNISFNWTASSDTYCGKCIDGVNGYACKYWLQGRWYDRAGVATSSWFVNNGAWTPASYSVPSYSPVSCVGKEGYTAKLIVRQAKDNVSNGTSDPGEVWANAGSFTCPIPDPTIGTFRVGPINPGVRGGSYGRSGLRSTEPALNAQQTGSNYYNSIKLQVDVTANMSNDSLENIGLSGVGYGNNTPGTTLASLKASALAGDGFIVLFSRENINLADGPTAGTATSQSGCAGYNFCRDKYYAYYKGQWRNFTTSGKFPENCYDGISRVTPTPGTPPPPCELVAKARADLVDAGYSDVQRPSFQMDFFKNLGTKKWNTYGYVYNFLSQGHIIQSKTATDWP